MNIQVNYNYNQIQLSSNSIQKQSFSAIYIYETEVQRLVLKNIKTKDFEKLKTITQENLKNPIDAFISSKNGKTLTAKIYCPYYIKNFKENYKQIPFFESKIAFISRMSKKINEYKQIVEKSLNL